MEVERKALSGAERTRFRARARYGVRARARYGLTDSWMRATFPGMRSLPACVAIAVSLAAEPSIAASYLFTHLAGPSGLSFEDGVGAAARFWSPDAIARDAGGSLHVSDAFNHVIKVVSPAGEVRTLAGLAAIAGKADGRRADARFSQPGGLGFDPAGNLFVADTGNNTIRMVTPDGVVTTIAGIPGVQGSNDGRVGTTFNAPSGIAVDASGNVYVADLGNHTIRKITAAGDVSTLAGLAGVTGKTDATGPNARFNYPRDLALSPSGDLFVADGYNNKIRRVTPGGVVTTFAGSGLRGNRDGPGASAQFDHPAGVSVDAAGNVYVVDSSSTVRLVTPSAVVSTLAGSPYAPGSADGNGAAARFYLPSRLSADAAGVLAVADRGTIRIVSAAGDVTTLAGKAGKYPQPEDGLGEAAGFFAPTGIALDPGGDLLVAESSHTIRRVTRAGQVTTLAGSGNRGGADGTGSAASFAYPAGLAVDGLGNAYVADYGNHTIRRVTPLGEVTTLAGTADMMGSADGSGAAARFNTPSGIALASDGNLYVADTGNLTIRRVTMAGDVTTVAGAAGVSGGADGPGASARFGDPADIAAGPSGSLYVADGSVLRRIDLAGPLTVTTVPTAPPYLAPKGIGVDAAGNVWAAGAGTLEMITPAGAVTTVAGRPFFYGNAEGTGDAARLDPWDVAVAADGSVFVVSWITNNVWQASAQLDDRAVVDLPFADLGTPRQLDVQPQTATSWQWTFIRRPAGSTAELSSDTIRNPVFVPDVDDLYEFRVVATGPAGRSITTVHIDVCQLAQVVESPPSSSVCAGDPVQLSVRATGQPPLSYQWSKDAGDLAGATSADLSLGAVSTGDSGVYVCKVTSSCGDAASAPAVLTVATAPGPLADPISLVRDATGDLVFHWTGVAPATSWEVYADSDAKGPFATLVTTGSDGTAGAAVPLPADALLFYRIAGRDACGLGPR